MAHTDEMPDNQRKAKPKKFDWGAVLVALVLGVATILGLSLWDKIMDEYRIHDYVQRHRPSFQYRIWLRDMPEANASNTFSVAEMQNGDIYMQSTGLYTDGTLELTFFRETVLDGMDASYIYLHGWTDRPTILTISTYQSSFTREDGYVLGDLIKQETIKVTPWLFFFYSVEVIDVYVNTDLS